MVLSILPARDFRAGIEFDFRGIPPQGGANIAETRLVIPPLTGAAQTRFQTEFRAAAPFKRARLVTAALLEVLHTQYRWHPAWLVEQTVSDANLGALANALAGTSPEQRSAEYS